MRVHPGLVLVWVRKLVLEQRKNEIGSLIRDAEHLESKLLPNLQRLELRALCGQVDIHKRIEMFARDVGKTLVEALDEVHRFRAARKRAHSGADTSEDIIVVKEIERILRGRLALDVIVAVAAAVEFVEEIFDDIPDIRSRCDGGCSTIDIRSERIARRVVGDEVLAPIRRVVDDNLQLVPERFELIIQGIALIAADVSRRLLGEIFQLREEIADLGHRGTCRLDDRACSCDAALDALIGFQVRLQASCEAVRRIRWADYAKEPATHRFHFGIGLPQDLEGQEGGSRWGGGEEGHD